ncbi:MAG: reverse transcriptase family protein [Sedimenticola sp.]
MIKHKLSIVHYNVQSFLHKKDILYAELSDFDILCFTETWLSAEISSDDLLFTRYSVPFRQDRAADPHGGILLYVNEQLHAVRRGDLEVPGIECIWIELRIHGKRLLLGTFYRPPNSPAVTLSSIENSIGLAVDTGVSDIVITGDLNLDMLKQPSASKINSIAQQYNLTQAIMDPTHFTEHSSSLIDIFLTSSDVQVALSGVGEPFLDQNVRFHCPVFLLLNDVKPRAPTYTRKIWIYEQGDYDTLRQMARHFNWETVTHADIDTYTSNITSKISDFAQLTIPNKVITVRPSDPPWLHSEIRKSMRKRKRAYDKAKASNTPQHWTTYKHLRNATTTLVRNAKKNHKDNLSAELNSCTHSSSNWWSSLKSFIKSDASSSIPPLKHNDQVHTDGNAKANLLNTFFTSQTRIDDDNKTLPNIDIDPNRPTLNSIIITPLEVQSTLETLKLGKAAGPDYINNRVLKELSSELSKPLCNLFNQSLQLAQVPSKWKEAFVCAVLKQGDPSDVSNYRPISLLCTIEKVMEKIIHKHIFNFFNTNNIITALQSGFVPKDSTVNQLVDVYNTFCKALDDGKEVRAVFCDISKAFDRVWHRGLVLKLRSAGITGSLLSWISNYLQNRRQCVVLPGFSSDFSPVYAGVPQGSILGPLLFLVYINDIVLGINSTIKLFADDTSLYIVVDTPDNAALALNSDLETIHEWAGKWLVSFNPTKTESLLISRKTNKPIHPALIMNNTTIQEVDHHKHLGLTLSNNGTWHSHFENTLSKAWTRTHILRKLKFQLNRKTLETMYISFIRPVLEYADVVWDNCTRYQVQDLEKVQLEAARIVTGTTKLVSFDALYRETGWETLESRRRKHKLLLMYKMHNGLVPSFLTSLLPANVGDNVEYNLRNARNTRTVACKTQLYQNSFLPSTIHEWNNLTPDLRNSASLNIFKNQLNSNITPIPSYYYSGKRDAQILHTRIRTNCSNLNQHLFTKNIVDNPLCTCGAVESTHHFFVHCPLYAGPRRQLSDSLTQLDIPIDDIHILLHGNSSASDETNTIIFRVVQDYVTRTKRFRQY